VTQNKATEARQRLSREQGTIIKDWGGRLPIALIYPNSYYVGMSNLGIHAIYSLLNSHADVVCERAFREKDNAIGQTPPLSIESQRPLSDFAVLALSITYELDYFNVVQMLKASGIPLYATDRDERHPLVIAGGPCIIANPMPLSPFFDCLCIGEAEAILPSILPIIAEGIKGPREDLLKSLAAVPGIYVPLFRDGTPVARQWIKNLDDFPVHSVVLTPDTELGNLYLMEIERGCNWGCRFCLVSNAFRPMRFRSLDKLLAQAEEGLKYRKRLGMVGPAVSNHPHFEELVTGLQQMGAQLSVSSLRIKPLPSTALGELARGGARTITFAPEAASQRLRHLIKKGFSEDDILEAIDEVAQHGFRQLRLYFVIGLPTETDDEVEQIASLALRAKERLDRAKRGCRLTLSVAPFVPKAGTPFQWLSMEQPDILERRLSLLKNRLQPKGINLKHDSLAWPEVQTVLSRGGVEVARALADVERVSLSNWRKSARKHRLDIDYYAHQRWNIADELPWSIVDSGTVADHLQFELDSALAQTR
jgi:radical SAM superfamily enzyme YgiQ (UPF0313 family)